MRGARRLSWIRVAIGAAAGLTLLFAALPTLISAEPPTTFARIQSVLELYGRGERAAARSACVALTAETPQEGAVWLLFGMLEEDRGAWDAAADAYRRARGLFEGDAAQTREIDVSLAELLRRKGDAAGALAALDKATAAGGVSARARHARALALTDLGRAEDALREVRLLADEPFSGGLARLLERRIRAATGAAESRGG